MPPKGRPWQKGQSGNPAGRKPGVGLKDEILRDLDRVDGLSGKRRLELLAQRLGDLALGGDPVALRLVVDRLWPAKLELGGESLVKLQVIDYSDRREDDEPSSAELNLGRAILDLESTAHPAPGHYDQPTAARTRPSEPPAAPPPAEPRPAPPEKPQIMISRPWLDRGGMQTTADYD